MVNLGMMHYVSWCAFNSQLDRHCKNWHAASVYLSGHWTVTAVVTSRRWTLWNIDFSNNQWKQWR